MGLTGAGLTFYPTHRQSPQGRETCNTVQNRNDPQVTVKATDQTSKAHGKAPFQAMVAAGSVGALT